MRRSAPLALFALVLTSCPAPQPYVVADKAIYDAIAPDYTRYVTADATLDEDTKATKLRTLTAWRRMIDKALQSSK